MSVSDERRIRLHLLGGFAVDNGREQPPIAVASQRVVALTALSAPAPLRRCRAAGTLWPNCAERRATGNLRSAVWRLQRACPGLILATEHDLRIAPGVWVDIDHIGSFDAGDGDSRWWLGPLGAELLPGWYDEWLVPERERLRQTMVHALEATCRQLIDAGEHGAVVDLGLRAVAAEPLRESANRLVIEAHLAEGNVAAAVEQFQLFARALDAALGIAPTESLFALLAAHGIGPAHRGHAPMLASRTAV